MCNAITFNGALVIKHETVEKAFQGRLKDILFMKLIATSASHLNHHQSDYVYEPQTNLSDIAEHNPILALFIHGREARENQYLIVSRAHYLCLIHNNCERSIT